MAITIETSDVKRKAMIDSSDTTYDDAIDDLIDEMQGSLEYSIADVYLNDTTNTNLQATLALGMLEVITGEFIEQLAREAGATETFSAGGVSVGAPTSRGVDLIQQGATRLSPFLKNALPMMADTASSGNTTDSDAVFSIEEEVW